MILINIDTDTDATTVVLVKDLYSMTSLANQRHATNRGLGRASI